MRLLGLGAEPALAISLVIGVVALEPHDLAVAFEGQDMGRDAIEEPAIMGDNHGAAGKILERVLERAQGVDIQVVGRLVEQDHICRGLQHLREMDAVALPA